MATSAVRELPPQVIGSETFTYLHHIRCAVCRPDPDEQVQVIGLNRQRKDHPNLFLAFLLNQFLAVIGYRACKDLFAATGTPDRMIDDQMDTMFIALVFKWRACLLHSLAIPQIRHMCKFV